jgi:flagellar L-ring protein precursor FlgH
MNMHPRYVIASGQRPRGNPARRSFALDCFAALAMTSLMCPSPALAKKRPQPDFAATLPATPAPAPANGSIFQPATGYAALHEGMRARAVGDPLTIVLVESTTTSKSVGSKSQKGGNVGLVPPVTGPFSFLSADALKASSSSSFNGKGDASQTSTLGATLSVTIAEVRPNGTALVRGEKRMMLSQGKEWVRFSGIVRLADIDVENRVPSTRVADAHIEYSGKGALQRASKPGWLSRFFNAISPF